MFDAFEFIKAVPVWEKGQSLAVNHTLDFISHLKNQPGSKLFVAGSSSFIIYVNGKFAGFGPARAAHGFYRVDEILLDNFLDREDNILDIRVSGYAANSFCYLDQPSFLCAEVVCGDQVVSATGEDFKAIGFKSRFVKAPRYSYQRTFCEAYTLNSASYDAQLYGTGKAVDLEIQESKSFIPRAVPYCEYKRLAPEMLIKSGDFTLTDFDALYPDFRTVPKNDNYKGFYDSELEILPQKEYGSLLFEGNRPCDGDVADFTLSKNSFTDMTMGKNYTGLFDFTVEFKQKGTLCIAFDELMDDDAPKWTRVALNVLTIKAEAGKYHFTSAEPYVLQMLRFAAKDAEIRITDFSLIEIAYPESLVKLTFDSENKDMEKIYDAALRSFRSNSVDIFMDCASRERAGWLCDAFFTGRTEWILTGKTPVEKAFLENFLMPRSFKHLPDGMLPMCYPADVMKNEFIPNWAMWFGLEVYDYFTRTGDRELVDNARERLYGLLEYFKKFENEFGLLEKLEGWIFVEWSKANDLVQDVNFPSNMTYAALKSAIGTLYNDSKLIEEGKAIRETVKNMAMTESGFFCDNAVRQNGKLILTNERTEVCQYYAFFFKIATPESHPWLWNTMVENFGFNRPEPDKYSEIYPANAFIGNYLRMELLLLNGINDRLFNDIKDYFLYMAELTGTLWEHKDAGASCNHGFASYVIYWLKNLDILK